MTLSVRDPHNLDLLLSLGSELTSIQEELKAIIPDVIEAYDYLYRYGQQRGENRLLYLNGYMKDAAYRCTDNARNSFTNSKTHLKEIKSLLKKLSKCLSPNDRRSLLPIIIQQQKTISQIVDALSECLNAQLYLQMADKAAELRIVLSNRK